MLKVGLPPGVRKLIPLCLSIKAKLPFGDAFGDAFDGAKRIALESRRECFWWLTCLPVSR
jgi:hypothetical protein